MRSDGRGRLRASGAVALLLAAAVIVVLHSGKAATVAGDLIDRVSAYGPWAFLAFVLSVAGTVLLLLPGAVLPMGGGFLFGVAEGTALFVLGEMMGAVLAFGIARYLLQARLKGFFRGHPRLEVLTAALTGEGWFVIALTRLVPFFPFKLSNYFFGAMGVRFRDFFWGTLVGTLPLSFLLVYLGSVTAGLAELREGPASGEPWRLAIPAALGILGMAGLGLVSRRIGRAYRTRMESAPGSRRHDGKPEKVSG